MKKTLLTLALFAANPAAGAAYGAGEAAGAPSRWLIVVAVILGMAALAVAFGVGLALASKRFAVKIDPKVEAIAATLPGANCGACGYPGCSGYAEAVAGGEAVAKVLASIMGVQVELKEREVARLHCHRTGVADKYIYSGVRDCRAAALIHGGPVECSYGCIGFDTCAEACKFDALIMGPEGLPVVIEANCVACGACVKACPKGLFELVPESKTVVVRCSSHDKGGVVRKMCQTGCIACQKCVKACPVEAISMADFLSVIDYDICRNCGDCVKACPMHTIADLTERPEDERDASCDADAGGAGGEPVGAGARGG